MSDVPENMQHNLANLEQQAHGQGRHGGQFSARHDSQGSIMQSPPPQAQYQQRNHSYRQNDLELHKDVGSYAQGRQINGQPSWQEPMQQPKFSPFPVLHNPPPNVPPTAEQKQASLEAARRPVLGSNDPSNQLDWAQDALAHIEEETQNEQRISGQSNARLSQAQQLLKDDAMKVIKFLADQQHPRALVLRGIWLEFGKFEHGIDKRQAWQCYKTAVENAAKLSIYDPAKKWGGRAQYRIGMQFENSREIVSAIKYYQLGVDLGDSAACYRMGMMVLLGQHGQPQDLQRGLNLIAIAAENADENAPQGAYVLGMLQAHELPQVTLPEDVLAQDLSSARINIERAAFLGFAKAQAKMGTAYELCELGCHFDPALSLHYNNLAARQGEADAEMAISKWFLAGHEGVFDKDEEMAFKFAQRAAQDGLPTAQFAIGYFHEVGIYVPVNLRVAKEWYNMASSNGNDDATGRIEGISRSKTLSRKDHERIAVSKIKKSRVQGAVESAPRVQSTQGVIDMPDPHSRGNSFSAPYPPSSEAGRPRPGHVSHGSHFSGEMQPGAAFGINPNLRPSSAALGAPRPERMSRPGLSGPGQPGSNYVDGAPSPRAGNSRVASGPAGAPYHANSSQGLPPVGGRRSPQPPSKADIGYLAPLDRPGSARPSSTLNSPQSPLPPSSDGGRPPRIDSVPPPSASGTPQAKPSAPSASASQKPAAADPFGKGPKTFDEMGVPAKKGKEECVSFVFLLVFIFLNFDIPFSFPLFLFDFGLFLSS